MSDFRVRTSLQNSPSGWTAEQLRERADKIGADAWRSQGLLVINFHDPKLNWTDKELLKQLARKLKFGEYRDGRNDGTDT